MAKALVYAVLLGVASSSPFPEAYPEPLAQNPDTIPSWGISPAAARACSCGANFQPPPCNLSACECRNSAYVACWITRNARCNLTLSQCPGIPGVGGLTYDMCNTTRPVCSKGTICRKLDVLCNQPGCLGLCVPPPPRGAAGGPPSKDGVVPKSAGAELGEMLGGFLGALSQPKTPKQVPAKPAQPAQPAQPGQPAQPTKAQPPPPPPTPVQLLENGCPATLCQAGEVCVQDPHTQNPQFKCAKADAICGGWRNDPCEDTQVCVKDPRINCLGQGCTGVCVA